MAKKKQLKTGDNFIDTCLWMSARYAIGRKSIAATYHAPEICEFLAANPDWISGDRRKFFGKDIMREVNMHLGFYPNIHIEGDDMKDALGPLIAKIIEMSANGRNIYNSYDNKDGFDPDRYRWEINTDTREVRCEPLPPEKYNCTRDMISDIMDLVPWFKLAQWLNPLYNVTYTYDGSTITDKAIRYPSYGRYQGDPRMTLEIHTSLTDKYQEHPFNDSYISHEYIDHFAEL